MPRQHHLIPHVLVAVSLTAVTVSAGPSDDATKRLRATAAAALKTAPSLAADRERIAADAARGRAELAPGSPSLQVQREGLGGGFSHQPNSASYLRLARELRYPWLLDEARAARDTTSRRASTAAAVAETSLAAEAARRWLELAAATDRAALIETRRARLEDAVRIQSTRLEVGEVSGSDLLQLRLELAAVTARHAAALTAQNRLTGSLELLCGDRCAPPKAGDLAALADKPEIRSGALPGPSALSRSIRRRVLEETMNLERARRRVDRAEAWGRPEAEIEWEHVPSLGGEPSFDALGLLLSVPLPVSSSRGRLPSPGSHRTGLVGLTSGSSARRGPGIGLYSGAGFATRSYPYCSLSCAWTMVCWV